MAPTMPNQKRKRGGPAALSLAANDASQRATRSRGTDNEPAVATDDPPTADITLVDNKENGNSGKRGRPRKGESKPVEEKADAATGGVRRSKRDRRSADDSPWWISGSNGAEEEEEEEEVSDSSAPLKKRARISVGAVTGLKKQGVRPRRAEQESTPSQTEPAKSPRRSKAGAVPAGEPSTLVEPEPKRRGRPRKSDASRTRDEEPPVEEVPQLKKRGRPRLSNVSASGQIPSEQPKTKSPAKHRLVKKPVTEGRRNSTAPQRRLSKNPDSQEANQSVAEMDDELEASLLPVPKYRHIEPRTRQIPRSTISAKWLPLDDASVEAISTIISDTTRPVLLRLRDKELRHQQGQIILRIFAGRLRSKLRKGMPFPPPSTKAAGSRGDKADAGGGHVEELSFESTVDSIESLETMLDPLLHSVALLEKEKVKEEAALEKEYETLRTLESNAKAEARSWRESLKKAHPLAPEPAKRKDMQELDRASGEGPELVKHKSTPLSGVFHDTKDKGLLSMSQQIASHMESIQKNVQPIQEVLPAIGKSRAALQSVLQTHLAPQQFERVLLG
ncbi:hypothetical protein CONLIGDRAFT_433072 [Coniochaeta ligniaria NRRL 30616]|uniref:Kinetochore protein fta7 n=1 Tax=Coniochaeta ligniaria NRRL 30616 TaxID=1408157 RepID=A0A1J7IJ28_9PEZI|nr:hypothetical protein CONLIGDRAFT_433072 [Coniochaeta ligniaria NRRL 30616]